MLSKQPKFYCRICQKEITGVSEVSLRDHYVHPHAQCRKCGTDVKILDDYKVFPIRGGQCILQCGSEPHLTKSCLNSE